MKTITLFITILCPICLMTAILEKSGKFSNVYANVFNTYYIVLLKMVSAVRYEITTRHYYGIRTKDLYNII